jgi:two-component system, LytTR family, response regulator LytT
MDDHDKLRVLILEDEWVARDFLSEIVQGCGVATVVGAVGGYADAVAFLECSAAGAPVDVVFVDINLIGSPASGLDLIRRYQDAPGAPAFVLATALDAHALEAYSLGVADYILKPFHRQRVAQCLEKLHARRQTARTVTAPMAAAKSNRIAARNKRNIIFLLLEEVWAIEAREGLCLVHCERGEFDVDLSLDTVANSLGCTLFRVHRNWLVNEDHILELERDDGDVALWVGNRAPNTARLRVPVARDRAAAVRSRLIEDSVGIRRR